MAIRMKAGAPPDEQLRVRVTTVRGYEPNPKDYFEWSSSEARQNGEDGVPCTDGTLLGAMVYDKTNIEANEFAIEELFQNPDEDTHVWELVDEHGNVWTEEYDDEDGS